MLRELDIRIGITFVKISSDETMKRVSGEFKISSKYVIILTYCGTAIELNDAEKALLVSYLREVFNRRRCVVRFKKQLQMAPILLFCQLESGCVKSDAYFPNSEEFQRAMTSSSEFMKNVVNYLVNKTQKGSFRSEGTIVVKVEKRKQCDAFSEYESENMMYLNCPIVHSINFHQCLPFCYIFL